jgi:hypothetical protein
MVFRSFSITSSLKAKSKTPAMALIIAHFPSQYGVYELIDAFVCIIFRIMSTIYSGDKMKDNKELLTSILHTVQMGQTGIRSVHANAIRPALRSELDNQLKEYDSIEKEAIQLAKARDMYLSNVNPAIRQMSKIMSQIRLIGGDVDSKIAGMLIQGNTRGIILGVKNLNRADSRDDQVLQLARKLLNLENMNIQKSQQFL